MTATSPDRAPNEVFLRGRLGAEPELRSLPSGDELCVFRLTVDRAVDAREHSRVRVDSIDCVTTRAGVRRVVERCEVGDVVEVSGRLQRRFWRSPGGPSSRYEVVVATAAADRVSRRRRSVGGSVPTQASA